MSVSEYTVELDRLLADTDSLGESPENGPAVARALPTSWTVTDGQRTFNVPTQWLRSELQKAADPKSGSPPKIRERLVAMRAEAQAYSSGVADNPTERTAINNILARREFRNVHGPTWWDELKRRILEWLLRLVSRMFGSSAFPTVARVVVWTIVGIAVVVVGWAVFRAIRRNAGLESIVIDAQPVSAKPWTAWMEEARAAAAKAEWRDAIHLAYWAGISLLEARGMWRPDRARTPREYLRLLPSQSEHRPALTGLTRRFEVVWYGYGTADEPACAQTLTELEKLGCR